MDISALFSTLMETLNGWLHAAVAILPNLAAAIAVAVVTWLLARAVGRWVSQGLNRFVPSAHDSQLPNLTGAVARIGVLAAGLFVALGILHLDKTVTSLLAGVGVIGLALGFAFQDMAANFISGVMLAIKKPFVAGETIEYGNETGVVVRVDLRDTEIRRFSGEIVIVPNRKLLETELTNVSRAEVRRVDLDVGVGYTTDLQQAQDIACAAIAALPGVLADDHTVESFFTGFGASSIDMRLRFWVDYKSRPIDFLRLKSEAIKAIQVAFADAEISIPFPMRTLELPPQILQLAAADSNAA